MNSVILIGRLTRDPDLKYASASQMAVAKFSLAVDRPKRDGKEKETDFPRVTVFGKAAENAAKYLSKGRLCCVQGRLQTGQYQDKDGKTVYTTDVIADRVEFLEWGDRQNQQGGNMQPATTQNVQQTFDDASFDEPDSFVAIEEDIPF